MVDEDPAAERADALYAGSLGEFVKDRNNLARALRQEGHRAEAAWVAKLKKPSPPAWAMNQLARRHRALVDELLCALDAQRELQLSAGTAAEIHAAGGRGRVAMAALKDALPALLEAEGITGGKVVVDRVERGLRAAAQREDSRQRLLAGRLEEEPEGGGFSALAAGLDEAQLRAAIGRTAPPLAPPAAPRPVHGPRGEAQPTARRRHDAAQARARATGHAASPASSPTETTSAAEPAPARPPALPAATRTEPRPRDDERHREEERVTQAREREARRQQQTEQRERAIHDVRVALERLRADEPALRAEVDERRAVAAAARHALEIAEAEARRAERRLSAHRTEEQSLKSRLRVLERDLDG